MITTTHYQVSASVKLNQFSDCYCPAVSLTLNLSGCLSTDHDDPPSNSEQMSSKVG